MHIDLITSITLYLKSAYSKWHSVLGKCAKIHNTSFKLISLSHCVFEMFCFTHSGPYTHHRITQNSTHTCVRRRPGRSGPAPWPGRTPVPGCAVGLGTVGGTGRRCGVIMPLCYVLRVHASLRLTQKVKGDGSRRELGRRPRPCSVPARQPAACAMSHGVRAAPRRLSRTSP